MLDFFWQGSPKSERQEYRENSSVVTSVAHLTQCSGAAWLGIGEEEDRYAVYVMQDVNRKGDHCTVHVRSGDTYKPDGAYKQKTTLAVRNFTSKFSLMGSPPIAAHCSQRSCHRRSVSAKSAAPLFLHPPPHPSRRPPG